MSNRHGPSALLREQIRTFIGPTERYHDSKQNRAYLAAAAYTGGGVSLLARSEPPWAGYSCFALFMLLGFVLALSAIVFRFVCLEFAGRRYASDLIGAFIDVYSASLKTEFDDGLLEPVTDPRFQGGDKWPRAIAEAFGRRVERTHTRIWPARFLPISAMCLTLAAFLWHIGVILVNRAQ